MTGREELELPRGCGAHSRRACRPAPPARAGRTRFSAGEEAQRRGSGLLPKKRSECRRERRAGRGGPRSDAVRRRRRRTRSSTSGTSHRRASRGSRSPSRLGALRAAGRCIRQPRPSSA
jgi:hypothetical protein